MADPNPEVTVVKLRELVVTVTVALTVGWVGRSVWSDDKPAPPPPATPKPADPMEAWTKLAQPGEQHARLKALVGEYAVHGKSWNPDGTITEGESTSSVAMVLGDRYLRQEVKGTFQGSPFEGRGIMGYDNGKKKWVSAWIDTMGTGIMLSEGEETVKGRVWTFDGTFHGPDGPVAMKDVLTVMADGDLNWQSFFGGGDKAAMVLTYKKK